MLHQLHWDGTNCARRVRICARSPACRSLLPRLSQWRLSGMNGALLFSLWFFWVRLLRRPASGRKGKQRGRKKTEKHRTLSLSTNGAVSSPFHHRCRLFAPQGCQGLAAAADPRPAGARLQVQAGAASQGGGVGAARRAQQVPQGGRPHDRPDSGRRAARRHPGRRQGRRRGCDGSC